MGNFIKETAAKVAGNVTQSVTSAVIVTLITTYVLVDIGKKDSTGSVSHSDSLKINSALQSIQRPDNQTNISAEKNTAQDRSTFENKPFLTDGNRKSDRPAMPAGEVSRDAGENSVAEKELKNRKPETSLAAAKSKTDSVAKEKQIPKDIKEVQKRGEDIFDELDEEVAKKPPQ